MKKYLITNDTNSDRLEIDAEDETAARHWVINHLNLSLNWTIAEVSPVGRPVVIGDVADALIGLFGYALSDLTTNGALDRRKVNDVLTSLDAEQQAEALNYRRRKDAA